MDAGSNGVARLSHENNTILNAFYRKQRNYCLNLEACMEYAEREKLPFRYKQNTGSKIRGGLPLQKGRDREKKKLSLTKQKYRFHIKKPLPKRGDKIKDQKLCVLPISGNLIFFSIRFTFSHFIFFVEIAVFFHFLLTFPFPCKPIY